MPKRTGADSKLPFDGQRPDYTTLNIEGVDTRFASRWANYLKHYEEETGRKPDPGILLANIVGPALETDKKFVQKEGNGHFNATSNGATTPGRGATGRGAAGGGTAGGGGSTNS